jgi:D-glycero-D-manno-heptose 1,7-bisphosphate phosphatase
LSQRAIFLDRDGTIIRDKGFISDILHVVLYTKTIDALRLAQKKFSLFIVTNQAGVGRGIITLDEAKRVNDHVVRLLKSNGVNIKELYSCPHIDEDRCDCRKPAPRFLYDARDRYGIDLEKSYVIGDHPSDVELAINAGAQGLYVLTGHGRKHRNEINRKVIAFRNIYYACRFADEN